jgi:hypothetical protein
VEGAGPGEPPRHLRQRPARARAGARPRRLPGGRRVHLPGLARSLQGGEARPRGRRPGGGPRRGDGNPPRRDRLRLSPSGAPAGRPRRPAGDRRRASSELLRPGSPSPGARPRRRPRGTRRRAASGRRRGGLVPDLPFVRRRRGLRREPDDRGAGAARARGPADRPRPGGRSVRQRGRRGPPLPRLRAAAGAGRPARRPLRRHRRVRRPWRRVRSLRPCGPSGWSGRTGGSRRPSWAMDWWGRARPCAAPGT